MWISSIISFLIGWILSRLLQRFGGIYSVYDITHEQIINDLPIRFRKRWWIELLSILLPPKEERFYADVTYIYDGDVWPIKPIWEEEGHPEILIRNSMIRHLQIWNYVNGKKVAFDYKPLPRIYTIDVRVKNVSNGKTRAHFSIDYENQT